MYFYILLILNIAPLAQTIVQDFNSQRPPVEIPLRLPSKGPLPKVPRNIWHHVMDYLTLAEILSFAVVSKSCLNAVNTYPESYGRVKRQFSSDMGLNYMRHQNLNSIDKYLLSIDKSFGLYQRYYRMLSVYFFKLWAIIAICLVLLITPILHSLSFVADIGLIVRLFCFNSCR